MTRPVVWVGRGSAREVAFLLAFADRVKTFDIIDITGLRSDYTRPDGTRRTCSPAEAVSIVPAHVLERLIGTERTVTEQERSEWQARWRGLKRENAPFRVVSTAGLVSAPIDHFDQLVIGAATTEWQRANRVIAHALGHERTFLQVGDVMPLSRLVSLVNEGRILADGDPWDMRTCLIRLAE